MFKLFKNVQRVKSIQKGFLCLGKKFKLKCNYLVVLVLTPFNQIIEEYQKIIHPC